jgi:hypothetical protein
MMSKMNIECFEKKGNSSRGKDIRSTLDIPPEWKDIRKSHIPPNQNDMRSIAGILSYMKLRSYRSCRRKL